MSAKSIKTADKRNIIIETAYRLFKQNTIAATAIDDIVKSAGIARGTFYLYFKDKSDLLEQLISIKSLECAKELFNGLRQTIERPFDYRIAAESFVNAYIDFLIGHKEVLMILEKNISIWIRNMKVPVEDDFFEVFNILIDELVRYGYTKQKAQMLLYSAVELIGSACSDAILYSKPYDIETIRPVIVESSVNILLNSSKGEENNV